jgi:hypothetical protein
MTRTTLDLDPSVLRELKRRTRESGESISELASQLLAHALNEPASALPELARHSERTSARIVREDEEAQQGRKAATGNAFDELYGSLAMDEPVDSYIKGSRGSITAKSPPSVMARRTR